MLGSFVLYCLPLHLTVLINSENHLPGLGVVQSIASGWTNQSSPRKARLRMKDGSLQGAFASSCKAEAALALVGPEKLIPDAMKIYGSGPPDLFFVKV